MLTDLEARRALIVAAPAAGARLRQLFAHPLLQAWRPLTADDFEQARFVLQHQTCDVLLIDDSVYRGPQTDGLAWVLSRCAAPALLLARAEPERVAEALEHGVTQWLPPEQALEHPGLLAAALQQAAHVGGLRRQARDTAGLLRQSRRQVDHLVGLLWKALPADARTRWHPQREMMERLREEVGRSARHGTPLTLVLGEVGDPAAPGPGGVGAELAERVCRVKRFTDVAGQYGPGGFLVLLPHTPESGGVAFCRRLQTALGRPADPEGPGVYFGLASYSAAAPTSRRLLSLAEQHLEAARTEGGGLGAAV